MSRVLNPITRQKINAFQQRRRWLLGTRGVCIIITLSILVLLTAVAVDYLWLLEGRGRWALALFFYTVLLGSVAGVMVPVLRRLSPATVARLIEQREPKLRETVLPAIQLQDQKDGSPAFRQQVIRLAEVALQSVSIRGLLPLGLIAGWIAIALVTILFFAGLTVWASDRLTQHIARVLLPAADLGRPSPTRFLEIEPGPQHLVPPGEIIVFQTRIERPVRWSQQPVLLQWRSDSQEIQQWQMTALEIDRPSSDPDEKSSAGQPSSDRLSGRMEQSLTLQRPLEQTGEFRLVADGAFTPWQTIQVVPRPRIQTFHHRLIFPEYARTPDLEWSAPTAGLSAVAGSQWEVTVQADQPLSDAHWEWESDARLEPEQQTLSETEPNRWQGRFLLQESARIRLQGQSRSSHLQLTYLPQQLLTVQPDRPPVIRWLEPLERRQTTSAQSLLRLETLVEDEFPLERLTAQIQVDRQPWQDIQRLEIPTFAIQPQQVRYQNQLTWKLDLMELPLAVGQVVELRVEAVDRNGATSYSPNLTLVVSGTQLDWKIPTELQNRMTMLDQVLQFGDQWHLETLEPAISEWEQSPDRSTRQAVYENLLQLGQRGRAACQSLAESLEQSLPETRDPVIADQQVLTRVWLNHLETMETPELERLIAEWETRDEMQPSDAWPQVRSQYQRISKRTASLADRYRNWVSVDLLADLGDDLFTAQRFAQEAANDSPVGSITWRRQQELLARHMRAVTQKMVDYRPLLPESQREELRNWARWAGETADRLDQLIESESDPSSLQRDQQTILNEFRYHQNVMNLAGDWVKQNQETVDQLQQQAGVASELLQAIHDEVENPSDADNGLARLRLNQLALRRQWEYLRPDVNGQRAADLGAAYRATLRSWKTGVASQSADTATQPPPIVRFAKAFRQLEIDHHLARADSLLTRLKLQERFATNTFRIFSHHVRDWEMLRYHVDRAHELAKPAEMPDQDERVLGSFRWSESMGQVGQAIGPRRWDPNHTVSASAGLESLQTQLNSARTALKPTFDQARRVLQQAGPSVVELAGDAAVDAAQQDAAARSMAQEQQQSPIPNLPQRLQDQYHAQLATDHSLPQLADALRDMASSQDLLIPEQREIARQADIAQAMVRHVREQIIQSMANASSAPPDLAQQAIEHWAHTEAQAAETLQVIADHFQNAQADTATLLAAAEAVGALPPRSERIESAYQQAESLDQLQEQSPASLMRQLEEELQRSSEMRSELSNISRSIAEQSEANLQRAADRQREMRDNNEKSDRRYQFRKEQMHRDLDQLAEQALDVANQAHNRLGDAAGQIQQTDERDQLRQQANDLRDSALAVKRTNATRPAQEMQQAAEELLASTTRLVSTMEEVRKIAGERKQEMPHEDANLWRQAEQRSQRLQEDAQAEAIREAKQITESGERLLKRDQQERQRAERQSEQAERNVAEAKKKFEQQPDQEWLQRQLEQQLRQQQEAQEGEQLAEQSVERQQQRLERAREEEERLLKQTIPSLQAGNPAAEMTEGLAQRLQIQSQQLEQEVRSLVQDRQWQQQLEASRRQLATHADQQQTVRQTVQQTARDLRRAAEHEQRLNRQPIGQQLEEMANRVTAIDQQDLETSERSMQLASETDDPVNDRQADTRTSQEIQRGLERAGENLSQQVEQLETLRQQARRQTQAGNSTANSSASQPASSLPQALQSMSPQQQAQMLDRLSQTPGSSPAEPTPSASQQPSGQQTAGPRPAISDTLAEAAQRLANRMNQQRQSQLPSQTNSLAQAILQSQSGQESGSPQPTASPAASASPVQMLPAQETDLSGEWSQLRRQSAEDVVETQRPTISPRYQKQVEAYFKLLSQQRQNQP